MEPEEEPEHGFDLLDRLAAALLQRVALGALRRQVREVVREVVAALREAGALRRQPAAPVVAAPAARPAIAQPRAAQQRDAAPAAARGPPPPPAEAAALAQDAPWEAREGLAREAGQWVRRVLDWGFAQTRVIHGPSPRRRQPLRSRIWLCFADFEGEPLQPVVASWTYGSLEPICMQVDDLGNSVTMGWPSQREARACVEAAGCVWPAVVLR